MATETLVKVEGRTWVGLFVAAFVIRDGVVVEAAPYLRKHLMGRTTDEAREVISAKGWKATVVRGVAVAS